MRTTALLFIGCFTFGCLNAVFQEPWAGELLEFNWQNRFLCQHYARIDSDGKTIHYKNNDLFLKSSLLVFLPDPNSFSPDYSLELGVMQASTRKQSGGIDHLSLTGSYQILEDIQGDYISLKTGISYFQAFGQSLYDISSFHHGREEGELFLAFGQENLCRLSRWWIAAALGFADRGSPWIRLNIDYRFSPFDNHQIGLNCHCLYGFGGDRLKIKDFKGYGSIAHRSVDLGLNYTILIENFGQIGLSYTYRVLAKNFPQQAQVVQLEWNYTFGLIN